MKGTKLRTRVTLPSNSKNIGIQTESFDSLIEIAKLEEQVKVMQLEINILRKHMGTLKKPDVANHKTVPLTSSAMVKLNIEKSSCGCKGNCSSRICGCVRKNIKCNLSCKCGDKACQNQNFDQNQEGKENINEIDVTKNKNRKKNETTKKLNRHLFSPDMGELSNVFEEIQFSDIDFSSNKKNTFAINTQTDLHSIDKVKLKKKKKKEENNKEQQESMDVQITFDPMKPRHQLSRTPPKKLEKSLEVDVTIQPQLHFEPTREIISSHTLYQDSKEENINWKEHNAQLIPCKKCKRTFMPNRIQKHETCCKG
ncbi:hypothetical protein ALC53_09423 [Atta colombica]|uniref:C2HC/C3H-type domain-containing protein n=1 Tax=Atta colombica TaxID=520822 RepID=A0A195B807_9HYME|nr:PREDICTED: uncharacterized protein LOC108689340 [Atta colombica]KYM80329.1 hypothetical protein ALC53_09423 [Atta colombica]